MTAQVSLVIPVRNERESLASLLDSVRNQTRPPDEVILVDGGSTDGTAALACTLTASDPRFRVIEAGNATPGRGRNVGFEAARNDWVALTDAGIRLDPHWLAELLAVVEREPAVRVVYGHYEPTRATAFERSAKLTYVAPTTARQAGRMRGPFVASMLLHTSVWRAVGGFPDRRAAEDLIFMEQIAQLGTPTGWAPRAVVHWQVQPTAAQTFRRFALYSMHNVWAGRQRDWHYGVARQYLVAAVVVLVAALHSLWWLTLLPVWGITRVAKTVWTRRHGERASTLLNPLVLARVACLLAVIDAATFVGWGQALVRRPPGEGGR